MLFIWQAVAACYELSPGSPIFFNARALKKIGEAGDKANILSGKQELSDHKLIICSDMYVFGFV